MTGCGEWLMVLLVILLLFGIPRLPQIGESLGRAVKNYRRASRGLDEVVVKKRDLPEAEGRDATKEPGDDR
ncbi:MAG: twin-arginine translocase TatA/TatE family subunit [Deltaproteobacteria bacterium]|nr:twin-arginine translocase TatA/TatE family subunit [Deltaproteobacteria bacterium]